MRPLFTVVALVCVSVTVLLGQSVDSLPDRTELSPVLLWGIDNLKLFLVPLLAAWVVKKWNVAQAHFDTMNNTLKSVIYIVINTAMMYLGELLSVAVTPDAGQWDATFWHGIVSGLVGTILVKLGINTVREKAARARTGNFRAPPV